MTDLHDALTLLADRVVVDDRLDDIVGSGAIATGRAARRRSRRWPAVAASIALIVGAIGLITLRRGADSDTPVAESSSAIEVPPGFPQPLFVLPTDRRGLGDGRIAAGLVSAEGAISLVGVRDGDGFRDLFTISVFEGRFDVDAVGSESEPVEWEPVEWEPVELATGPAGFVREPDGDATLIQQRGAFWLRVDAEASEAMRSMEAASVAVDGALTFGTEDLVVLSVQPTDAVPLVTTSFRTAAGVLVETATAESPFDVGDTAAVAEPITIGSRAGWRLTEVTEDGSVAVRLVWMEVPDRRVTVSGDVPLDELLAVAADLTVVDEATWRARVDTSPALDGAP
jgi:hypothetical protein